MVCNLWSINQYVVLILGWSYFWGGAKVEGQSTMYLHVININ